MNFCNNIPEELREECFGEVGKWIWMVYTENEDRIQSCLKSTKSDYFLSCMKANLENIQML